MPPAVRSLLESAVVRAAGLLGGVGVALGGGTDAAVDAEAPRIGGGRVAGALTDVLLLGNKNDHILKKGSVKSIGLTIHKHVEKQKIRIVCRISSRARTVFTTARGLVTSIYSGNLAKVRSTRSETTDRDCTEGKSSRIRSYTHESLEVLDASEFREHVLQPGEDVELAGVLVVLHKCPELFQSVELADLAVSDGLLLEIFEELRPELALKAVAEEAEETLQTVPMERAW